MPDDVRRIPITRDDEPLGRDDAMGFIARHPDLTYVFGPTVRGFYVVGCLAVDLLAPLQVILLLPGQDFLIPILALVFGGLAYLECLGYRRLWPSRRRERVAVAGKRRT